MRPWRAGMTSVVASDDSVSPSDVVLSTPARKSPSRWYRLTVGHEHPSAPSACQRRLGLPPRKPSTADAPLPYRLHRMTDRGWRNAHRVRGARHSSPLTHPSVRATADQSPRRASATTPSLPALPRLNRRFSTPRCATRHPLARALERTGRRAVGEPPTDLC